MGDQQFAPAGILRSWITRYLSDENPVLPDMLIVRVAETTGYSAEARERVSRAAQPTYSRGCPDRLELSRIKKIGSA